MRRRCGGLVERFKAVELLLWDVGGERLMFSARRKEYSTLSFGCNVFA